MRESFALLDRDCSNQYRATGGFDRFDLSCGDLLDFLGIRFLKANGRLVLGLNQPDDKSLFLVLVIERIKLVNAFNFVGDRSILFFF